MWKNIKAGGLLDCTALLAGKRPFLATKYHTRQKIVHNSVETYYTLIKGKVPKSLLLSLGKKLDLIFGMYNVGPAFS